MEPKYRTIIEQATKLAERSISAFESEKRLQEIEPQFKNLCSKEAAFRSKANHMADVLVTRGILEDSNKVAFVNSISEDHNELIDVAIRLSSEMKAESFGKVGEAEQFSSLDPFEKLAME